jgi:hypothetical protein
MQSTPLGVWMSHSKGGGLMVIRVLPFLAEYITRDREIDLLVHLWFYCGHVHHCPGRREHRADLLQNIPLNKQVCRYNAQHQRPYQRHK